MSKYGFWIIPDGETYESLRATINHLAEQHSAPIFSPHMTIHGVVESTDDQIIKKVQRAAKHIFQFKLELGLVEFSSTYFQCIFVRLKTTAPLFNAHLELRKAFGITEKHVYMPHASLLYSDMSMNEREKVTQSIKLKPSSFTAKAISIVRADQHDPATWEVVAKIPLTSQK